MDDEVRKMTEMSEAELEARWESAEPAEVRKREDFSQRMHRVVAETAERSERDEADRPVYVLRVTAEQSTLRARDMAVFTPVTVEHRG